MVRMVGTKRGTVVVKQEEKGYAKPGKPHQRPMEPQARHVAAQGNDAGGRTTPQRQDSKVRCTTKRGRNLNKEEDALHLNKPPKKITQKAVANDAKARPAPNGVRPKTGTKRNSPTRKGGIHPLLQSCDSQPPTGKSEARETPAKE